MKKFFLRFKHFFRSYFIVDSFFWYVIMFGHCKNTDESASVFIAYLIKAFFGVLFSVVFFDDGFKNKKTSEATPPSEEKIIGEKGIEKCK